jgi:hypothetical protein
MSTAFAGYLCSNAMANAQNHLKLNCSSSWNTKPNSKKKTFKVYV